MMGKTTAVRLTVSIAVLLPLIGTGAACSSNTPESRQSSTAAAAPFAGFIEPVSGTRGVITYRAELPQLRGGDAAVRDRFNSSMHAALDDHLKPVVTDVPTTVAPGALGQNNRSRVSHIGTGAVAGVLLLNTFVDHAAHPFNTVSTVVIDAHTAKPIMITDLFTDQATGLTALVNAIKTAIDADPTLAHQSAPDPVADQLADWVPDHDGLVVYIPVAHVYGDYYPIPVGWDAIAGVLRPGIRDTLTA